MTRLRIKFLALPLLDMMMDPRIMERLESKILEASARRAEISNIIKAVGSDATTPYAITIGMLYNSFYYQTRRICSRDPTPKETEEFIAMLSERRSDIKCALDD